MQMLNDIVDPTATTFGIFNCEKLFMDVWNGYLEQTTMPGVAEARVDRMMNLGRQTNGILPPLQDAAVRQQMYDFITDQPARFEESRRHYFMIDLYPENAARFTLEIAKVPEPELAGA